MSLLAAVRIWRLYGASGILQLASDRYLHSTLKITPTVRAICTSAKVLEIGGYSAVFRAGGLLPIYPSIKVLDNVNFAAVTIWNSAQANRSPSVRGCPPGMQYVYEATNLAGLSSSAYDVVISSHTLEHVANPLLALREWRRVCRPRGTLVLILPHRDGTFDWRRPVTTMAHLLKDEALSTPESDLSHMEEVLRLHDIDRDPGVSSMSLLRERIKNNSLLRVVHHHVFDTRLAIAAVEHTGWHIEMAEAHLPHHIAIVARNGTPAGPPVICRSPFRSDLGLFRSVNMVEWQPPG